MKSHTPALPKPPSPGNTGSRSLPEAAREHLRRPANQRIRLLLADDHPIVRRGIVSTLAHHPNLEIVGEAVNGQEAVWGGGGVVWGVVLFWLGVGRFGFLFV